MYCVVTAGPTYEPLDRVRRLTNFSTGQLGIRLANSLVARGHRVTLLVSEQATWTGPRLAQHLEGFGATQSLRDQLAARAGPDVDAVFHVAAVSDFFCARIWSQSTEGQFEELHDGKISTSYPSLLAELRPTPKLLAHLRDWFPRAHLVGWKYEVDGDQASVLEKAQRQLAENRTDACVANGPAYGPGFGLVLAQQEVCHLPDQETLFTELADWLERSNSHYDSDRDAG